MTPITAGDISNLTESAKRYLWYCAKYCEWANAEAVKMQLPVRRLRVDVDDTGKHIKRVMLMTKLECEMNEYELKDFIQTKVVLDLLREEYEADYEFN